MSINSFKAGHLFLFSWLLSCVIAHAIDSTPPLCGGIGGESNEGHKIYFRDNDRGIRTVEMNGTIVGCFPNALVVDELRSDFLMSSFRPNISKCAGQYEIFCSSGDNYPIDYVRFLLHKHWHMLSFAFHNDVHDPNESVIDSVIETETDICKSNDQVIYPTSGQNMDGKNLFIINTPEHQQGVRISVCQEKSKPCTDFYVSEKNRYKTQCEQRYVYRELLALSNDGVPIKEKFKFPAFCRCKIYYDNNNLDSNEKSDEILTIN